MSGRDDIRSTPRVEWLLLAAAALLLLLPVLYLWAATR